MPPMLAPVSADHVDAHPVDAVIGRADNPRTFAVPADRVHVKFAGHKLADRHPVDQVLLRDTSGISNLPNAAMPPFDHKVDNTFTERPRVRR